jgi:hypothetical protein
MGSQLSIIGIVKIVERDLNGNILSEYTDNNIVTTLGKQTILKALTTKNSNAFTINTITYGDDYGTGTVLAPQPPTVDYVTATQTVKYTTAFSNISIVYPNSTSVKFVATVNGANVMALYPSLPNIILTSATLRDENNTTVAVKRFPARTISALTSMDIEWTLQIL